MAAFASNSVTNVYSLNTVNFLVNAVAVSTSTVTNIFNSGNSQVIFNAGPVASIWFQETPEPINQRTIWG